MEAKAAGWEEAAGTVWEADLEEAGDSEAVEVKEEAEGSEAEGSAAAKGKVGAGLAVEGEGGTDLAVVTAVETAAAAAGWA